MELLCVCYACILALCTHVYMSDMGQLLRPGLLLQRVILILGSFAEV